MKCFPNKLLRLAELAAANRGGGEAAVQYVSARLIPIVYNKAILESEDDLDAYLAAVKHSTN